MEAPKEFKQRLERDFDGRLRIRWSDAKGEWHIEQRVGRASLPPVYVSEYNDDLIRARDGYWFVMSIRPGDRMPCPNCHTTISVPVMRTGEAKCEYCRARGAQWLFRAAYYPLGDALIDRLKQLDPYRTYRDRQAQRMDAHNRLIMQAAQREASNIIEGATKDHFNQLVGIQSVGYTGREFKG